jgi:hypothetical protein
MWASFLKFQIGRGRDKGKVKVLHCIYDRDQNS